MYCIDLPARNRRVGSVYYMSYVRVNENTRCRVVTTGGKVGTVHPFTGMIPPLPQRGMRRAEMSARELLQELRARGAKRLRVVSFRSNRSTIWSLTRGETALNLHTAYRKASPAIVQAFATIARERGAQTPAVRRACALVEAWPPLEREMRELSTAHSRRARRNGNGKAPTHCCATPEQRTYLRALYRYFNETRFGGRLPNNIPVRLSSRMITSLGHMLPGVHDNGRRTVLEIALSEDLMLPGNGAERVDTLLHEMAHAADYLFDGNRDHGSSWREWARLAGCRAQRLYERPVRRRRNRRRRVTRVPPLPPALRRRLG